MNDPTEAWLSERLAQPAAPARDRAFAAAVDADLRRLDKARRMRRLAGFAVLALAAAGLGTIGHQLALAVSETLSPHSAGLAASLPGWLAYAAATIVFTVVFREALVEATRR